MCPRSVRTLVMLVGAAIVAVVLAFVGGASPSRAADHSRAAGVPLGCVKAVVGAGGGSARPVAGSASSKVVSQLAVFRATRSAADVLPSTAGVGPALRQVGAVSCDPSAAVLLSGDGSRGGVYAVPASLSQTLVSTACDGVGVGGW
jgi:hypothetical protein